MPNTTYDKQQADALAFIKASQDNWNWTDQEIADFVNQFPDNPQTKVVLSFLDLDEEVLRVTTHSVRRV
tara:strand:- start:139 stop:345 length:207 start_codon:yes stop_codon:yes gene_type:complete